MIANSDDLDILPIKYENFFTYPIESRREVFDFLELEDYAVRDFAGEKYGDLNALTNEEYDVCRRLFAPLIRDWDTMAMNDLILSHGPFTQDLVNQRLAA